MSLTTPKATSFTLNTKSTDWNSEEWSVPINLMVAQIVKLGGKPVQIGAGLRYWADAPEVGKMGSAVERNVPVSEEWLTLAAAVQMAGGRPSGSIGGGPRNQKRVLVRGAFKSMIFWHFCKNKGDTDAQDDTNGGGQPFSGRWICDPAVLARRFLDLPLAIVCYHEQKVSWVVGYLETVNADGSAVYGRGWFVGNGERHRVVDFTNRVAALDCYQRSLD